MAINRDEDGRFQEMARALAVQDQPRKTKIASSLDEGFDSLEMDDYLLRKDDDEENYDSRMYVRDYARPSGGVPGYGGFEAGLSFWLPLNDLGDGVVDIRAYAGPHNGQQGTFTRATVASCRLKSGLLKKVASDVPRSHYLADGTYGGYLAEGARTNLALQSEDFATTWSNTASTDSPNVTTAPDGTLTADKIIEDASVTTQHFVSQSITFTNVVHTFSCFVKAAERTWVMLNVFDGTTSRSCYFNVGAGVVGTANNTTGSIESWGNGWYRCVVTTSVATAAAAGNVAVLLATGDNGQTYTGDGASGAYAWGAQLEAAAFASSYIPTTTASVPRDADVLYYVGAGNVDGLLGTCYAELMTAQAVAAPATVFIAISGNGYALWLQNGDASTAIATSDGSNNAVKTGLSDMRTAPRKRASSWGPAGQRVTGDGLAVGTQTLDANGLGPAANLYVGGLAADNKPYAPMKNVRIWQRALPDVQLQSLTA